MVLLVRWTKICANFWLIYLTATAFGAGCVCVCKTQNNDVKTVSSQTIHSTKGSHRMCSGDKFQTYLNCFLEQKVTMFYEVKLGGTYRTQLQSV